MEEVIFYLCPEIDRGTLDEKTRLVSKYFSERVFPVPVINRTVVKPTCEVCGNDDENLMIKTPGELICLGRDGQGCGCVIIERMYEAEKENISPDSSALYSEQHRFKSFWNGRSHSLRRINDEVEKTLTRCGSDTPVTSDMYKDSQREYVYGLLDNMKILTTVDHEWIDSVKSMFHTYRISMMRIHKLHVTLAALFAFVKETSCRN